MRRSRPAILQTLLLKAADQLVQLHHRRRRHLDLATRCCWWRRARRRSTEADIRQRPDPARNSARHLTRSLTDLAVQVVQDGEGAEKLVTIDVTGAASAAAARRIGLSIANSPLVKTAIAGEDANWGRIVMAVGKAGEKAERDKLAISIGGVLIAAQGPARRRITTRRRSPRISRGRDIKIGVDVGVGTGKARVWTCDLTHRYIEINADYRS